MTEGHRRNAAYLLQLRDDLDRLDETRWEWVAPGTMSLLTFVLLVVSVLTSGTVGPAGLILALISAGTGSWAIRVARERRAEANAILERIQRIESGLPEPGDA